VHDDIHVQAASDHVVVPEQITRDQHTLGPCSSRQGLDTHVIAFYGCICDERAFSGPTRGDRQGLQTCGGLTGAPETEGLRDTP
jgi:hypothetical protein